MTVTLDAADRPAAGIRREAVDPAGWTGAELEARSDWRFQATAAETAHLVDMARVAAARLDGDPERLLVTARSDFDLGPFAERVDAMLESVRDGPGIALYRGLPMDDLSLLEAATAYWAMGLHMGIARSNNPEGDMIGHVLDAGRVYGHPRHRGYQTAATMDYHCDQTDAVALLCIHTAKSGGLSKIASSVRLYNEVLRRRPDLLDVLTRPFCWTKHGETDAGEIPYFESPVFNFHDGRLSTAFGPQHIQKGPRARRDAGHDAGAARGHRPRLGARRRAPRRHGVQAGRHPDPQQLHRHPHQDGVRGLAGARTKARAVAPLAVDPGFPPADPLFGAVVRGRQPGGHAAPDPARL